MRLAALLALGCALGCNRDFNVPQQTHPPPPSNVTFDPPQGFSGDLVWVHGDSLGDPTSSRVLVGDQPAQIVEGVRDGSGLRILVPDNAGNTISVITPDGRAVAAAKFGWLGLGHPRNIAVRTVFDLGPHVELVQPQGTSVLMLDTLHDLAVSVDPATGNIAAPAPMPHGSVLVAGSAAIPWTFTVGSLDLTDPLDPTPALARLDLAGGGTWTSVPLTGVVPYSTDGVTVANRSILYASRSDSGAWIAVPAGGAQLKLAQIAGTTVTQQLLSLPVNPDSRGHVTIAGTAFAADQAVFGFANAQPFRVDLPAGGGAVSAVAGAPLADPNALAAIGFPMAVDPNNRRMAYVRADGDIGFLGWDAAAGAAPVLSTTVLKTFANQADELAWTPSGDGLFAYESTHGLLVAYDATKAPPEPVSSLTLPNLNSLQPVRQGPATGNMMAALGNTGGLLISPSGVVVSQLAVRPLVPGEAAIALAPSGRVVVPTFFGPVSVDPNKLTSQTPVEYFSPVGVASGEGGLVAWGTGFLRTPTSGGGYQEFATIPAGALVKSAAASPDGKWIAAATCPPSPTDDTRCAKTGTFSIYLFPKDGSGMPVPPPLSWDGSSVPIHGAVLYVQGTLYAVQAQPGHLRLSRFDPNTLRESDGVDLSGDTLRGLWYSRAFDAVFTAASTSEESTGFLWPRAGGPALTVNLARPMQNPIALSADGRTLLSSSSGDLGRAPSVDAAVLQIDQASGTLHYLLGGHADVQGGRPESALPSADGSRFYLAVPGADLLVTIE